MEAMDSQKTLLKRTPLCETPVALGARLVAFAGWEMPLQYTSILDEARAVRANCGLFDVSHMGRILFTGEGAASFLNRILSADVLGLRVGRARYNLICNQDGGIIDDTVVYRLGEERFILVANASNTPSVLDWLARWAPGHSGLQFKEVTQEYSMIAFQGPQAVSIMDGLCPFPASSLKPFGCAETQVAGREVFLSRTGYTGEDGFELILSKEDAPYVWSVLLNKGAKPNGLGARDTLRLEAGLLLHGTDMDASVNPFEAGLERFVQAEKEGYIAGEALKRIQKAGITRRLVGFKVAARNIPRHHYPILDGNMEIGRVTSGGYSPTLDKSIGLGYVPVGYSAPGSRFQIDIRGRAVEAQVVPLPFYSRQRKQ